MDKAIVFNFPLTRFHWIWTCNKCSAFSERVENCITAITLKQTSKACGVIRPAKPDLHAILSSQKLNAPHNATFVNRRCSQTMVITDNNENSYMYTIFRNNPLTSGCNKETLCTSLLYLIHFCRLITKANSVFPVFVTSCCFQLLSFLSTTIVTALLSCFPLFMGIAGASHPLAQERNLLVSTRGGRCVVRGGSVVSCGGWGVGVVVLYLLETWSQIVCPTSISI